MDTYKIKWTDKDLICAVIQAESNFNIKAVNKNTNGTNDYGVAQINDYFWIGEHKYFKSVEEVLNNPEKSIRFMCEMFLAGRLALWCAYTNGSFKKFLKVA